MDPITHSNTMLFETMHRNKDVTLGEDRHTNRSDHAPQNIFTLTSGTLTLLKRIAKSPPRAIELVQDDRGTAVKPIAVAKNHVFSELP